MTWFRRAEVIVFVAFMGLWSFWALERPPHNPVFLWGFTHGTYTDGTLTLHGQLGVDERTAERGCKYFAERRFIGDLDQVDIPNEPWRTSRTGVFDIDPFRIDFDRALGERGKLVVTYHWACNPLHRLLGGITQSFDPIPVIRK